MPKPKKPSVLSETQELRVLLEEVRSQQKLILEQVSGLPERLEGVEFRLGRIEQDTSSFPRAFIENSGELRRLQHDIQKLQHDVVKLTERFEVHQKEHAT